MFWKFTEFLVRLVFFKRFRQADRIGVAVEAAGRGQCEDALQQLAKIEPKLHATLIPIFHLTKGRILMTMDRFTEAKIVLDQALGADPENPKMMLDMAVVEGRLYHFEDARQWLRRVKTIPDDAERSHSRAKDDADHLLAQLDKIESGALEIEYKRRAEEFAAKSIEPSNQPVGLPANLERLDEWIRSKPDEARKSADEIALLIGFSALQQPGAVARVGLSIEDFRVQRNGATDLAPFEIIAKRFARQDANLPDLVSNP